MTFIVVIICILLSGLLSAAEIAFVTARRSQIRSLESSGNPQAGLLRRLRENPERTLSVIQLGESFVSAIAAAVGFIGIAEYLSPFLVHKVGMSTGVAQSISIGVIVVGYTYLDVVFGELVPKVLALRHPLWIATLTSRFLLVLEYTLRPFVNFLEWSTRTFVQVFFRVKQWSPSKENSNEFEIDVLPDAHRHLVINAVALEKSRVKEIYLPWKNVVSLEWNMNFEQVAKVISENKFARYPVLREEKIEGLISSRDFMTMMLGDEKNWHGIIRKVARLQDSTSLLRALKTLQGRKNQMAVVHSGSEIVGLITMQDIFEQIIGDIYDEDDAKSLRHILGSTQRFPVPVKSLSDPSPRRN